MSKYKFKLDARTMALMSLLIACEIVLSRFCSVNTHGVKLGFSFIPAALCGIILGPAVLPHHRPYRSGRHCSRSVLRRFS